MNDRGWIGVDLDGTLAKYEGWKGIGHVGEPVPAMVERVRQWIADGWEVRVFTARMSAPDEADRKRAYSAIAEWTRQHVGRPLAATCTKDFAMAELWDDRAVQVVPNTGQAVGHDKGRFGV